MQRIHAIKSIANDTPIPDIKVHLCFCLFIQINFFFLKKLDESSSMLSVTCDAFIHTLDECVKLATGDSSQSLLLLSPHLPIATDAISKHRQSFCDMDSTKFVK
jgi:hypothetical protein